MSPPRAPRPGARQRRLGQNFLADPNLLELIVREAGAAEDDVVLEVGGGAGALTERLAPRVGRIHVVELDERLRPRLDDLAQSAGNVNLVWGDAMRLDLAALKPPPNKMVSNLPYSIATPILLETITDLPSIETWVVMVQREIADRLRAGPGSKTYGAPSAIAQVACEVELVRNVGREVFQPKPRVDSAILRLRRRGAGATPALRRLVHGAFAHRRKALARSVELAGAGDRERVRAALDEMGLAADSRAEALAPEQFVELVERMGP